MGRGLISDIIQNRWIYALYVSPSSGSVSARAEVLWLIGRKLDVQPGADGFSASGA